MNESQEKTFKKLLDENKHKFEKSTMFGISISELDADSLRACICILGEINSEQSESHLKSLGMMRSIRR